MVNLPFCLPYCASGGAPGISSMTQKCRVQAHFPPREAPGMPQEPLPAVAAPLTTWLLTNRPRLQWKALDPLCEPC
jgi:hypothetical protein